MNVNLKIGIPVMEVCVMKYAMTITQMAVCAFVSWICQKSYAII